MKKYKLTDETMTFDGHTLHRIQALCDFGNVKEGDLGGWIENEDNLLQEDTCWVYDDAQVSGLAQIYGLARISGDTWIYGSANVYGLAKLKDHARIKSKTDYLCIGPLGSRNDFTTFYRNADGRIMVSCGCFSDDIEAFEQAVAEKHGESEYGKAYRAAICAAKTILIDKT